MGIDMKADGKKIMRIGVIGSCRRGTLADLAHRPDEGVEVVAGADISEGQLEAFKKRYRDNFQSEVTGYLDYRAMLEKEHLDGVIVTSPDFCHEEHAVTALGMRVPVYLEKPMAITIEGCDNILRAARDHKTKLMIGHNMRYMSFTAKMKEIIESGMIGEVKAIWCRHFISYGGDAYFRDWHADSTRSTGLLLQKGAHDIDIIHWLADAYSRRVSGMGSLSVYDKLPRRAEEGTEPVDVAFNESHWPPEEQDGFNPVMDVEDTSMMLMQLSNGVQASYQQCHFTPDQCRNYTVIGTRGRLENYGDFEGGATIEVWTRRVDHFRLRGDVTFRTDPTAGTHGGADPQIIAGFIGMLRGEHIPRSSPVAARQSVAAGCMATQSIRDGGGALDVPPLDPALAEHKYYL